MDVYFLNDKRKNLDINLYHCGMEKCEKGHFYGPAVRDHYLIHYILKGKGILRVGDKTYNIGENQGFLIEPNVLNYYEADMHEPWEYIWIGFNGVKGKEYMGRSNLSTENPILSHDGDLSLRSSMEEAVSILSMQSNKDILLMSILYKILFFIIEKYPCEGTSILRQQQYIEEALRVIDSNYSNDITIMDIAKLVNIDRSYLHRLFKEYVGTSPQKYLIEYRIEKACALLSNSRLTIADISRSVGYNDVFLFSKTFKKVKNITPSQFRNKLNEKD